MSSTSDMDQAYEAFLSSSDLEIWTASLDPYREILEGGGDVREARPVDIRRALTIAHYVAWLSNRCGDQDRRDRVVSSLHTLSARLAGAPQLGGDEAILIPAVIAATKGYFATARRMLKDLAAPLPVEIALLTAPDRAMQKATALKPFVLDGAGGFLPALHSYGAALLDLGYQSSVNELLERHRGAAASSLMIDLRGQLLELAGDWSKARAQYVDSKWASHVYRRAVCDLILGEPVDHLARWPAEMIQKFTAGMQEFSGETDRAGVLRSASFVRACRWSGFDNWLVHFELGRLGFQRRRHTEAERHLAAAARAAPEPYRFPIHSLRFTNLTWLRSAMDVDMKPEALEAGHAALLEPASEPQRASIRTWIGQFDGEAAVLDPVATSENDHECGNAHQLRGNVPDAIACWCACIAKSNTPRAFLQLLRVFASYGFENTASSLAETVALESEDSFFDLWELADAIADALEKQPPGRSGSRSLEDQLARVEARMEALVESEFPNAIRAFHHFLQRGRPAPARRMLARAERLAEGPEELLLLAIARRKASAGRWDPRALEALHLAERQSTDRFERLLIARELVTLEDLASARAILIEEGVLSGKPDLTPIEYILALRCAKLCASEAERKLLEAAAIDALKRDAGAGTFLRHGNRFVNRFNANLAGGPLELAFPARAEPPEGGMSSWRELLAQIERFQRDQQGEQELRLLNERVQTLSGAGSLPARFALWGLHLDRFDAHLRMIDRLRPTVADDELPMARDPSLERSRAKDAARLWRAYLLATAASDADLRLARIRAFRDEDKALEGRWVRLRNLEAEEPSKHALRYAKQGAVLLGDLGSDREGAELWPPFLGIRGAVIEDAKALAARLQERAASVRERGVP